MVYKNTMFLFIMQGVNYLLPVILIPFFTNTLGVLQYGNIAVWLAIIQFSYVVTDFGFLSFATKEIAGMNCDKNVISEFLSSVYGLKLILFIIVVVFVSIYGFIYSTALDVILFSLATIFCQSYQPIWFYHGIEKMKAVTFYFSLSKILYLGLVLLLIKDDSNWSLVIFFWFVSQLFACIVSNRIYLNMGYHFQVPTCSDIFYLFKRSLHFFISRISVATFTSLNVIILSAVVTGGSLASFAICDQVFKAGQAFTSPVTQALYPYLQRTKDWNLYIKMTLVSLLLLSSALFVFYFTYDFLFKFVFNNVPESIGVILPIFLILIIVNFVARNIGNPLFGPIDKLYIANNTVIFGAILHLVIISLLYSLDVLNAESLAFCVLCVETSILILRLFYLYKYRMLFFK